jgi:ESCRT-I complex subunit TSG101
VLAKFPSLSPETNVYSKSITSQQASGVECAIDTPSPLAYETGDFALLLHLSGTLPVTYRGQVYKFPIALWIPNTYPRDPPLAYVTPTQDMAVRVGQHVTLEGRIYHHYLAHWAGAWEVSTNGVLSGT